MTTTATLYAKTSDQTKNSDTALADDNTLAVALTAGKKYMITGVIAVYAHATPDFKYAWSFTGTANAEAGVTYAHIGRALAAGAATTTYPIGNGYLTTPITRSIAGSSTAEHRLGVQIEVMIDVSGDGTFSLQWAQNTSDANNTTVKAGSWLLVEEIS